MKNKVAVSGGNAPGSYHSLREQCFPKGHQTCSNECSVFLRTPARTLLTYQALKNVWHQLSLSEFLPLLTIGNSHVMNISLILLAPYVAKCFICFLLSPLIPKEIKISGSSFSPENFRLGTERRWEKVLFLSLYCPLIGTSLSVGKCFP